MKTEAGESAMRNQVFRIADMCYLELIEGKLKLIIYWDEHNTVVYEDVNQAQLAKAAAAALEVDDQ